MKERVKVLFGSGPEDLIPGAIERMRAIFPEIALVVVSEFAPPADCAWIPYHVGRSVGENLALCRASLKDREIRLCAVILQPRMPYWPMRAAALLLAPWNLVAFNENLDHFMLRPRSLGAIARHLLWRFRNQVVFEVNPGGGTYTFFWRLAHPAAFRRPLAAIAARLAGLLFAALKCLPTQSRNDPGNGAVTLPPGVSVVIPSRGGKHLLARGLPEVVRQIQRLGGEVIVSDNGSDDGSAEWLRSAYPKVVVICDPQALSFARAVNAGISVARFAHVCLLNNDMRIEPGFFDSLLRAFVQVPDLFCATAQIFFPEGARREETGKAVMPDPERREKTAFPVTCEPPIEGEDLSYVLYGSGGCSLYDLAKLRRLGALDPAYEPAYVEDLDLGVRGWRRGWPSVFVAGARVLHEHRATTSRHYTPEQLDGILELNYLRFLARAIADPRVFLRLWREAAERLNLLAARQPCNRAAMDALAQAWRIRPRQVPAGALSEERMLALGSGAAAVFPGKRSQGKPLVLIATPYLPFPLAHGGAVRMYNLMRRGAEDFDQVLISFVDDPAPIPREILDICVEAVTVKRFGSHLRRSTGRPDMVEEFDSPAFHAALRQTIRKWKPGIVQLEFTHMAQYAGDCAPAKTLLVEHDITLDLYRQLLAQAEDWETRRQLSRWISFETAAWRRVDCVVTMSEKDRETIRTGRSATLPNGVDIRRFRPSMEPPEPGRLLFIGSFAHLPNLLAIQFFLQEVWPRLQDLSVRLHIVAGARSQYYRDHYRARVRIDLEQSGIELDDFVSDVRPAYRRASVVVAPLLASAGTNIKIMEAMAMGKAVVSTPGGVNGLDLENGRDVIVTQTGAEMADNIRHLLKDREKRRVLEDQARRTVVGRFDWDAIARRQRDLYLRLWKDGAYEGLR